MDTSFTSGRALRLALVACAALSMTACASRPKPSTIAEATPTSQPQPATEQPAPPSGPVGQSVLPGSTQDFVVNVGDRVYFDFDQYSVRDDAAPLLDAQAAWLRNYPSVMVRIEGNADEKGTREYNLALGARRANAVREYLSTKGVSQSRISTVSFGKEQPIDPGVGDEADQRNRNARTNIISGAR